MLNKMQMPHTTHTQAENLTNAQTFVSPKHMLHTFTYKYMPKTLYPMPNAAITQCKPIESQQINMHTSLSNANAVSPTQCVCVCVCVPTGANVAF